MTQYLTADRVLGILLGIAGLVVFALGHLWSIPLEQGTGLLFVFTGAFLIGGYSLRGLKLPGGGEIDFERPISQPTESAPRKELPQEVKEERQKHADNLALPGSDAPAFNVLSDFAGLGAVPVADPMVPMYVLDKNYRILDWNEAFSLAFDRTMEGRRGMSVLEWVYFLDNYEQVLDHGVKTFGKIDNLPPIDIEPIEYTSMRYGKIRAMKRAYQLPSDEGLYSGWLVILDLSFGNADTGSAFHLDLITLLQNSLMWSEYATSYDLVLTNTNVYLKLLQEMMGEDGHLGKIPETARILDLGAGTGNITKHLADQSRHRVIFAIENNRTMLNLLKYKCEPYLRQDDQEGGVIALKQDIGTLYGLNENYFDYALMNNVLYSLNDPSSCLKEVCRVLKKGGEMRVSGPKKQTNLDRLFHQIKSELESKPGFESLREHYDRVERINRQYLSRMLFKWTVSDVEKMLLDAGLSKIVYSTEKAYGGQSMIVAARK